MEASEAKIMFDFVPHLILVGGVSGIGKTTTIQYMIDKFSNYYARPLSFTSRPKRRNESDNEYIFVSKKDIRLMLEKGEIITIDDVYGHLYAMGSLSVNNIINENLCPIKEIHPDNHCKIKDVIKNVLSVILIGKPHSDYDNKYTNQDRDDIDSEYYKNLDTSQFDVILRIEENQTIEEIVNNLHISLYSYCMTSKYFPPPSEIDKTNLNGYSLVASEFNDDMRPTTKNFHELSEQFFKNAIEKNVKPGMSCLEIGPGNGWLGSLLPIPDIKYFGQDICTNDFKNTYSHNIIQSSARSINFPDNYFDIIFASLADPFCFPAALAEIRRTLKKNGLFVFSSPTRTWSDGIRKENKLKTRFKLSSGAYSEVYSFTFESDELEKLLRLCGFSKIESNVGYGIMLEGKDISTDIINSANRLNIPFQKLPIINFIIAWR